MNIRDLHYFVVLAQVCHFGEAAKLCHVSQPTLSMQIKKLEEELGLILFERSNKQVIITEQGRLLVMQAQKILNDVKQMKDYARAAADPFAGELRLGVIPTLAPYLLPLIMPVIQKTYPQLRVWLVEEKTHRLVEKLANGELDAALMATPVESGFDSQVLFNEPFYFACSVDSAFYKKKSIRSDQLANQPILLLEEGHCLRDQAMAVCQVAKAKALADFTATSFETLRLMVQAGLGVTLMPALARQNEHSDSLHVIPFADLEPYRTITLYWRNNTSRLICLKAIAELITKEIHKVLTNP